MIKQRQLKRDVGLAVRLVAAPAEAHANTLCVVGLLEPRKYDKDSEQQHCGEDAGVHRHIHQPNPVLVQLPAAHVEAAAQADTLCLQQAEDKEHLL
jgi:hypothetical protein